MLALGEPGLRSGLLRLWGIGAAVLVLAAERYRRLGLGECFGVLRCAQDDGKGIMTMRQESGEVGADDGYGGNGGGFCAEDAGAQGDGLPVVIGEVL